MTLIVEDGTAKTDAESFCTVAFADDYHSKRGGSAWALLTESEKESNLRLATDYMEQVYRLAWAGFRRDDEQALSWPRYDVPIKDLYYNVYSSDIVPVEVQRACAILALTASTGELAPNVDRITKREKVDVIEVEYFDAGSPWVRYRAVDNLLAPLLTNAPGSASRPVMVSP